jgi:hypothetical protein
VRFLPDKPSLGFLRKEAKDLLAALRESNPEASLATAQRALAVEYGLTDWAELKAEAERRAAKLPVAPDGLVEALADAFGLGRVVGAAEPVSFTPMGRCWSITTDRGRWLAVTVYPWITAEQAEVGTRLRDAAVAVGVAAPTPVRSTEGRLVETVQEQAWRVHEWIEVGPSPVLPTPVAVARGVGTAYGKLHSLAIPSDTPINPYITWRRPDEEWDHLLERAHKAGKPWAGRFETALPHFLELRKIDASVPTDGLTLCNSNVIPEHVRVGHNDELVLTEWDFAGSLTPELELGSAFTQWALRPTLNPSAITAFRDGYVEAAGHWPRLEPASFAVAVTGYLNWTYNTFCEAIDPTDADQAEFSELGALALLNYPLTLAALEQVVVIAND